MHIRPPQYVEPHPGATTSADSLFTITLDEVVIQDCYRVDLNRAVIFVPRELIDKIIASDPVTPDGEAARRARYQATCARELLVFLGVLPQNEVQRRRLPGISHNALSLIGLMLDSGQAGVMVKETNEMLKTICVGFSGHRRSPTMGMGFKIYAESPDSRGFLPITWWIS